MRKGCAVLLLAGAVGLLAGCDDAAPAAPAARRPLYFDVKGLLAQQTKLLDQRHAAVVKLVTLRGQAPETARVPSVKWTDELQIFAQADINKAALRGAYTIDSVALPDGLTRRTYRRRPGRANAPVTRLVVVQRGSEPQEVAATIEQKNALFSTHKQLFFRLRAGQLQRYEVTGTQKLVLFDTLRYSAAGQVQ